MMRICVLFLCLLAILSFGCREDHSKHNEDVSMSTHAMIKPSDAGRTSTVKPYRGTIVRKIVLNGRVAYSQSRISRVTARTAGRIERLFVKTKYQLVVKNQPLMGIYSKDLVAEQENYLYVLKHDRENAELLATIESHLTLLGFTRSQFETLIATGKSSNTVTITSPVQGHVHEFEREGTFVDKGQTIFEIVGTDEVWILLDLPPDIHSAVSVGQQLTLSFLGSRQDTIVKNIQFIEPEQRTGNPFVTARVALDNRDGRYAIGSLVNASLKIETAESIIVPVTSIVKLGQSDVVFVKSDDNTYKAHMVKTGESNETEVAILYGLNGNESIAMNAQLIVDSESFIRDGF